MHLQLLLHSQLNLKQRLERFQQQLVNVQSKS